MKKANEWDRELKFRAIESSLNGLAPGAVLDVDQLTLDEVQEVREKYGQDYYILGHPSGKDQDSYAVHFTLKSGERQSA